MKFQELLGKLAQFRAADRAVSPVIGVILMVAITVILAAVVGVFVLDIGAEQDEAPAAAFDYVYDETTGILTISHVGGDSFTSSNSNDVQVLVNDESGSWAFDIEAGSQFTVGGVGSGADLELTSAFASGDEVKIIWTSPDGKQTNTVSRFQFA